MYFWHVTGQERVTNYLYELSWDLMRDTRKSFLETDLKLPLAIQKATLLVLFSAYSVSIKLLDIQNASRAL